MTKCIQIEISKQRLKAFDGETEIFNFPCVTGDAKHNTPLGKYKIQKKELSRRSYTYNVQMNFALQITSVGLFIHESYNFNQDPKKKDWKATLISDTTTTIMSNLRVWIPKIKDADISIGNVNPVGSHGCIRLGHSDAKQLFEWAELNISVLIN